MKVFMPELSQKERLMLLQQNADKIEQTTYQKPLTAEDLDVRREELTDNAIKLSELEDEKKEAVAVFKDKMDPLAKRNKSLLLEIKMKQASVDGTLFHLANHEDSMMETYDETGELVASRRLRPDEKQGRMFIAKTA